MIMKNLIIVLFAILLSFIPLKIFAQGGFPVADPTGLPNGTKVIVKSR
jgi:hypothetical protein